MNRWTFKTAVLIVALSALGGAPEAAPPQSVGIERSSPPAEAAAPVVAMAAEDGPAILKRWGIRIESLRLTAAGYMLDFRYHVVDARKAKPLFQRKTKPVLKDEKTGTVMAVPTPPKTGPLRSSNDPKAGRSYFMFFANPGRLIGDGQTATVTIGEFSVYGIRVTSGGQTPDPHAAHRAAAIVAVESRARRVMPVQPLLGDIPLIDQHRRATTLREALDTEMPVLVNFIFTTCTTVCPIMSRGFAQLQETLGPERDRVRLVSISIDPDLDSTDVLQSYAKRYRARDAWWLLTGTREASTAAQRSFGAYRGDKMNHAPATYVRRSRDAPWEVIEGLSSGDALLSVWHDLSPHAER